MSRRPIAPFPTSRGLMLPASALVLTALAACGGGGGGGGVGSVNPPPAPAASACSTTSAAPSATGFAVGTCIAVAGNLETITTVRRNVDANLTTVFPIPFNGAVNVTFSDPVVGNPPGTWTQASDDAVGRLEGVYGQSTNPAGGGSYALGDLSTANRLTLLTGASEGSAFPTTVNFGTGSLVAVQFGTWERFIPNGAGPINGIYGAWFRQVIAFSGTFPSSATYEGWFAGTIVSADERCSFSIPMSIAVSGTTANFSFTTNLFASNGTRCGNQPRQSGFNPVLSAVNATVTVGTATVSAPGTAPPNPQPTIEGGFFGADAREAGGRIFVRIDAPTSAVLVGAFGARRTN